MLESVISHLVSYSSIDPFQKQLKESYLVKVGADGEAMLWKPLGDQHITASCFVFSPDRNQILLTFHKKGQFWVQFGGHLEAGDDTLEAAAVREAREESGIDDLELTGGVVDLDRHDLHGGFTCSRHWDVGFAAIADPDAEFSVSDESEQVQWWPVDELPSGVTPDLPLRIRRARLYLENVVEGNYPPKG